MGLHEPEDQSAKASRPRTVVKRNFKIRHRHCLSNFRVLILASPPPPGFFFSFFFLFVFPLSFFPRGEMFLRFCLHRLEKTHSPRWSPEGDFMEQADIGGSKDQLTSPGKEF